MPQLFVPSKDANCARNQCNAGCCKSAVASCYQCTAEGTSDASGQGRNGCDLRCSLPGIWHCCLLLLPAPGVLSCGHAVGTTMVKQKPIRCVGAATCHGYVCGEQEETCHHGLRMAFDKASIPDVLTLFADLSLCSAAAVHRS